MMISYFPSRYQEAPDPPPPHRVIKGTQISKIHHMTSEICTDWKVPYKVISAYNRDKRVESLSRVHGERIKGKRHINGYEVWRAPESPWSMGPERPRYATDNRSRIDYDNHWKDKRHAPERLRHASGQLRLARTIEICSRTIHMHTAAKLTMTHIKTERI